MRGFIFDNLKLNLPSGLRDFSSKGIADIGQKSIDLCHLISL